MRIYIICPVRNATPEQFKFMENYVYEREQYYGDIVFYPPRDADQSDPTGEKIVDDELEAISDADEVHIFWDINSKGSHFDLGATMALAKKMKFIVSFNEEGPEKSYLKVIKIKESKQE